MRIDIITLFPGMISGFLNESILKRAREKDIASVHLHDLREFGLGKRKDVDDTPYGGGAGMVMRPEPVAACIESLKAQHEYAEIIYLAPDGELFEQSTANKLAFRGNLMLICGRYKGLDQRIRDHWVTRELSIGNYVLTGGELPAAVIADAVIRLLPGVLSDETSALTDSYQDSMLDAPVYTRPAVFKGYEVPEVLKSGDQKKIDSWRYEQALAKTRERRPDLLQDDDDQ